MGPLGGDAGLTPFLQEGAPKDCEMGDEELPTESGGESADTSEGPVSASPRLIPIPESPTNSGGPAFPQITEDSGKTSTSFDQRRALPQAPERVSGNYDHPSYSQIRDLRKARGYHKKDAKAALETRLEAIDAVERQSMKQTENDMDTSSSFLGKRSLDIGAANYGADSAKGGGETFTR